MVTKRTFGKLSSGEEIQIFHLENKAGAYAGRTEDRIFFRISVG